MTTGASVGTGSDADEGAEATGTGTLLLSVVLLRFGHVWFSPVPALLVLALGASLWIYRLLRRTHKQAQSDALKRWTVASASASNATPAADH